MNKRKLKAGYDWAGGRVYAANRTWWPEHEAPGECFEVEVAEPPKINDAGWCAWALCRHCAMYAWCGPPYGENDPLCGEASQPGPPAPKFEVGQWVRGTETGRAGIIAYISGKNAVVDFRPGVGEPCRTKFLKPCAPVCTEAQLAIRVGDKVRMAHQWNVSGRVNSSEVVPVGKVDRVESIWVEPDDGVLWVSVEGWPANIKLWNLEPVEPRT